MMVVREGTEIGRKPGSLIGLSLEAGERWHEELFLARVL
jgi:hypothetical protein